MIASVSAPAALEDLATTAPRRKQVIRQALPGGASLAHAWSSSGKAEAMAEIYAYENRPHRRVTIHLAECRECLHGLGKRGTGPTQNGSWTGAYASVDLAIAAVSSRQP